MELSDKTLGGPLTMDFIHTGGKFLRSAVAHVGTGLIFYSGALGLLKALTNVATGRCPCRVDMGSPFVVLLYHRVNRDRDSFFPSLSVTAFEAQMRYLAQNFRVLPLGKIVERLRAGRGIPPWTVAITFDDGYRDNYLYAHRILRKYELPATLFVSTAYIGTGEVLWNDRLSWAMKSTDLREIILPLPSGDLLLPIPTADEKRQVLAFILKKLKLCPEGQKNALVDALIRQLHDGQSEPEPCMLGWDELQLMAHAGWEIGSHTVNHAILSRVTEPEARQELVASKQVLEEQLQLPARLFAYPNGKQHDFTPVVKSLVRATGYEGAVTTMGGVNGTDIDPYEIRRQSPWEAYLPRFALNLHWSYCRAIGLVLPRQGRRAAV